MTSTIHPTPEEYQEAYTIVDEALTEANETLPTEQDIDVALRWTYEEGVKEQMDGVTGRAHYPDAIDLRFNTDTQQWDDALATATFHEYAHIYAFDHHDGHADYRWERLRNEALTQQFADMHTEYEPPWRNAYETEEMAEYWHDLREDGIERPLEAVIEDGNDPLFINDGTNTFPNWLGYSMAYRIGEELKQDHRLETFPTLEKATILEAGDRCFIDSEE